MRHSLSMPWTVNMPVFEFLNFCRFFVQFVKSLKGFYLANHPTYDNFLSSNASWHHVTGLGQRRLQNMTVNTSVFEILCFFAQFCESSPFAFQMPQIIISLAIQYTTMIQYYQMYTFRSFWLSKMHHKARFEPPKLGHFTSFTKRLLSHQRPYSTEISFAQKLAETQERVWFEGSHEIWRLTYQLLML